LQCSARKTRYATEETAAPRSIRWPAKRRYFHTIAGSFHTVCPQFSRDYFAEKMIIYVIFP
jgi:hypothetical protein